MLNRYVQEKTTKKCSSKNFEGDLTHFLYIVLGSTFNSQPLWSSKYLYTQQRLLLDKKSSSSKICLAHIQQKVCLSAHGFTEPFTACSHAIIMNECLVQQTFSNNDQDNKPKGRHSYHTRQEGSLSSGIDYNLQYRAIIVHRISIQERNSHLEKLLATKSEKYTCSR